MNYNYVTRYSGAADSFSVVRPCNPAWTVSVTSRFSHVLNRHFPISAALMPSIFSGLNPEKDYMISVIRGIAMDPKDQSRRLLENFPL